MAINNIDSQFATARAEVRALMKHCKRSTNIGARSIEVLQSIVDTLDSIQNDSYDHPTSFDRHPQNNQGIATLGHEFGFEDPAVSPDEEVTSPSLQTLKALEEMRQTDRLC